MKRYILSFLSLTLFLFTGCQELFTTSLAASLARDEKKVYAKVSTKELPSAIADIKASPSSKSAIALLDRIESLASSASSKDKVFLAVQAVEIADIALDLTAVLLDNLDYILEAETLEEIDVSDVLDSIAHVEGIAATLQAVLPEPGTEDWADFIEASDEDSLMFAAIAIISNEVLSQEDPAEFFFNLSIDSSDENPSLQLASALIETSSEGASEYYYEAFLEGFSGLPGFDEMFEKLGG